MRFRDYCSTCMYPLPPRKMFANVKERIRTTPCVPFRTIYESSMMYVYIVKQKGLGCVCIRKYIRRRRLAVPVSREASSVKLPTQSRCASSANCSSFSSSFPSLFLFVRSPLNTRFPAIAISTWCTYMHTYAYLYMFTHSPIPESWPMVIDTECRSFATSWNDYYVLSSLVFSLSLFYFPISLSLLHLLCNFTHSILHRERTPLCIFDLSLALLLSPSFAAVTIFLPDTRGIIRTGSLLAWRFVGEVYFLRCTRSFFSFLFVSCTVE